MTLRFFLWGLISIVLSLAVALACAYAPPPMRKVGLTYLIFGIASGLAMGRLAREFSLKRSLLLPCAAGLIVLGGGFQLGWTSFQQLKAVRAQQLKEHPEQLTMLKIAEEMANHDATLAETYQSERSQLQPDFLDYLQFRYSNLGDWNTAWACVFWGAEVLTAALFAGWIVWRTPHFVDAAPLESEL